MRHAPASFQCEWIEWSSHVAATVCKSPRLLCSSRAAAPCTWPLLRSDRSGAPQGLSAPPKPGLLPRPRPAQRALWLGPHRAPTPMQCGPRRKLSPGTGPVESRVCGLRGSRLVPGKQLRGCPRSGATPGSGAGETVTSAGGRRTAYGDSLVSPPPGPSGNHPFTFRPIPRPTPLSFSDQGLSSSPIDHRDLVTSVKAELGGPGVGSDT
ncbi:hypothetical protein TREES_T100000977 [Tupaia chinensis]|uniref:Uncharacterized protein n=1 Tax=Tupaia chinensis TaxID=246437 RepID=L9JCW5_TUPCH|nr:hypothetical protein TREES_T100000977 [Tupaia chinensis]